MEPFVSKRKPIKVTIESEEEMSIEEMFIKATEFLVESAAPNLSGNITELPYDFNKYHNIETYARIFNALFLNSLNTNNPAARLDKNESAYNHVMTLLKICHERGLLYPYNPRIDEINNFLKNRGASSDEQT